MGTAYSMAGGDNLGEGNILYLECGRDYITVYLWQNSLNCTFKMTQLYVNYNSEAD